MAAVLYGLLKKGLEIDWSNDCEQSFRFLSLLVHLFLLISDASNFALLHVLMQELLWCRFARG